MSAGRFMALGALSSLPVSLLTAFVHHTYASLDPAVAGPSTASILLSQLLWTAAGLFVAWRWSYLAWIRTTLTILSILSIPATIIGAWLAYVRLVGRFM